MPEFVPTTEQAAILGHDISTHARVLAGPGTGKSATLVALVNQLLAGKKRPKVRLLTFTRAATAELGKKVSEHPSLTVERPSTVHSFAISVLLRNPGVAGFPEPLRIADDWEDARIVRPTLARRIGVHVNKLNRLFHELASNWESLTPTQDPKVSATDRAKFMGGWQEHRETLGYTLLSELPYALLKALETHDDLDGLGYYLLVVDEYQDLNACDLAMLKLVARNGCSLIGAGDDDQSIYSFRRAAPEGIRHFLEDYPAAGDYSLSVTQRCGSSLMDWASYVIEGDPDRPAKPRLTCAPGSPNGEVALLSFRNEAQEANGIAAIVSNLVNVERIKPSDILILSRSDFRGTFSNPIKRALDRVAIPYSDPDVVKRLLAEPSNRLLLEHLRLLVNREDSLAWAAILLMTEGVGAAFFDYIYELARSHRRQFGAVLLEEHASAFVAGPKGSAARAAVAVDAVLHWLDQAQPLMEEDREGSWGQWIIELSESNGPTRPTDELQALLKELDDVVEADASLGRYLGQISPLGQDVALATSEGVRIMRMGGAKGLTVEATIIAGLEDGVIPRPDCDLAEERRLLYVGMTRAKRFLYATWARRRQGPTARSGTPRVGTPRGFSHFLREGPVASQDGPPFIRSRWPQ